MCIIHIAKVAVQRNIHIHVGLELGLGLGLVCGKDRKRRFLPTESWKKLPLVKGVTFMTVQIFL